MAQKPKLELASECDSEDTAAAAPDPASITAAATTEELDAEEHEFRALRRDLPGVKGASA
jgi:hypothetical protein